VGVDFSAGMLAAVPPEVALRVSGDATSLPLPSGSADVVCAMHMLYHVPDVPAALAEAQRVLRPGGAFVCSTNSEAAIRELVEPWSAAMESVGGPPLDRQSHHGFSVESAGSVLGAAFGSVDLQPLQVVARIPSADVVRDYVASTVDLYRPQLPEPHRWDEVLASVHGHAAAVIARQGTFDVTQRAGIFVCRAHLATT
jgi:SAM-dependent methyltransferase